MRPLLEMRGITKRFPGVVALDGVDFELLPGEVHVLLGENGAGKSTLIKILSGAYRPDGGEILMDGRPVEIRSAAEARRLGISTIYQEFNLVPQLTVAENIHLGRQPRRFGVVDRGAMERAARELLERLGIRVDPRARVADLGVARRQMVEIAKALGLRARVLIMDEPTAALSEREVRQLFRIVRRLKEEGVGVVFISHHLEEVAEIGERVTVLRDGRLVGRVSADAGRDELVRMMVGRSIEEQFPRRRTEPGEVLLEVRGLGRRGVLRDVSLRVRAGEIVGVAGLVGAGRTELARAIFGLDPADSGEVLVEGRPLEAPGPQEARRRGVGFVTEDRQGQGIVPPLSVAENLALASLERYLRGRVLVDRGRLLRRAREIVQSLRIRTPSLEQEIRYLSGGNQQKAVIGRWMLAGSRVLIMDEPTRGVDVGAKVEIYELMNRLTEEGAGILMISSEMPEVLGMSDRVLVMSGGRITGELPAEEATQERVMGLATAGSEAAVG
ncbi:ABC transporter related [Rubrobacter xylanophilus DSM 9941]|uniref:Ribose import ATP-binding protein RbsA 1 n=1 Tax=Rubrobacter xylanophilus (strain DSM 9941 / JCM 11954 / NBRC 16129 / PRD-1) TaxID=266117 RepID=RBSA1_RUBXD|nr:sugar ABC transporter ATP-binding protein [Rubrobacter xylanophilus]Q1AXG5.1 RecName: Full=Ribose import ATP-binding protein RbsA 1 [Rubrobacter xylanophilus DSM 9941]ABG03913.1 ABC transporter related [Rubrobacter xylanophilus DSM 9941]